MPAARMDTTPITLEKPEYIGRRATLGDYTDAFESLRGVMDPAPLFKGLPDDHCACSHRGFVMSGRIITRYPGHEETYQAGDAFYLPPGHLLLGEPGAELMTLSPAAELDKVTAAFARNARELPGGSEA